MTKQELFWEVRDCCDATHFAVKSLLHGCDSIKLNNIQLVELKSIEVSAKNDRAAMDRLIRELGNAV